MQCTELLTVEYILLFCSDFVETKDQYFRAQALKVLFKEISLDYYTIQYLYFSIYLSIIYFSMGFCPQKLCCSQSIPDHFVQIIT